MRSKKGQGKILWECLSEGLIPVTSGSLHETYMFTRI